jgi:hypothetical protein
MHPRSPRFSVLGRALLCTAFIALPLSAQPVRLELRPHAGDTLVLRIEQQTELISTIMRGSRDSSITIKTSMLMFARAVVQRADSSGAVMMAVTDSIRTGSTPEEAGDMDAAVREIEGKKVYMRLLPDGSSELISSDAAISKVVKALIADMPATMPKGPVQVGASWTRAVQVPLEAGARPYTVTTTFHLDSLSSDRHMAYISMRGVIAEQISAATAEGSTATSGDMHGKLTLDRQRGWIINSVANITINAIVRRPIESKLPPMKFQIRISQQMRTLNPR